MESGRVVTHDRRVDDQTIAACQRGDLEAFRLLFETYKDRVYNLALHLLRGDESTAEDVSQEVFVRLFATIRQYRHEAAFSTWLHRVVANACFNELRRRERLAPLDEAALLLQPPIPEPEENSEMAAAVHEALGGLSPSLRLAVTLKYFEDLSYEEMAFVMGCSKGTVASRLHRGLKTLAQRLTGLQTPPGTEP